MEFSVTNYNFKCKKVRTLKKYLHTTIKYLLPSSKAQFRSRHDTRISTRLITQVSDLYLIIIYLPILDLSITKIGDSNTVTTYKQ